MLWFAFAHICLQKVSERIPSKVGQLISLLLCIPCFELSNVLFKFVYLSRQRRLALLGAQAALLGGQDLSLQFPDLSFDGMNLVQIRNALRKVVRGLERRDSFGNSIGAGQD